MNEFDEAFLHPHSCSSLSGQIDDVEGDLVPGDQTLSSDSIVESTLGERLEMSGNGIVQKFDRWMSKPIYKASLLRSRGQNGQADRITNVIDGLKLRLLEAAQSPGGNVVSKGEINQIMQEAQRFALEHTEPLFLYGEER